MVKPAVTSARGGDTVDGCRGGYGGGGSGGVRACIRGGPRLFFFRSVEMRFFTSPLPHRNPIYDHHRHRHRRFTPKCRDYALIT